MKKLSVSLKFVIALSVLSLVFLSLAIGSAFYSVDRTNKAIDEIGEVSYSVEVKERIDRAHEYYTKLDKNLGLDKRIENADLLQKAEAEYVRLVIERLQNAINGGADDVAIRERIDEARATYDGYFSKNDSALVVNYSVLTSAESKYGKTASGGSQSGSEEDIELC